MKLPKTKLLPHYHSKPSWENGIGYLVDNRGVRLPGVTSILQATKSPLQKAQLTRWREKVGSVEANRIIQASKKRGTMIHELVSKHFLGQAYSCPDLIRPYWDNLLAILDNIDNIRLVEGNLFHYYLGYAGRVDCVANYLGIPCVIEFKSAERLKPLYDEPLQLAAYCGAVNRQYGLRLKNALVIVTTPDEASVTWYEPQQVTSNWHLWKQKVSDFWANNNASCVAAS
jgi:mitochondrial genome maintenance exonuclease 1